MELTKEQQAAVEHAGGPAFVISGPGGGKCVTANTLIPTSKGLIYIDKIPDHFDVTSDDECAAIVAASTEKGIQASTTSHWFDMGKSRTITVTTESGLSIQGTYEHPVQVVLENGDIVWKQLKEIKEGDIVTVSLGANLWGQQTLDSLTAYVLGLLIGDGTLSLRGGNFGLCRNDVRMEKAFRKFLKKVYNYDKVKTYNKNNSRSVTHTVSSVRIKKDLEVRYGVPMTRSPFKYIPNPVLCSDKETILQFLRGLFDTDASVDGKTFEYSTASERLGKEVQLVLFNLGVRAVRREKTVAAYPDRVYQLIHVTGDALRKLSEYKPFLLHAEKAEKLQKAIPDKSNPNKDLILNQHTRIRRLRDKYFSGQPFWHSKSGSLLEEKQEIGREPKKFGIKRYISGKRNPSKRAVKRILEFVPKNDPDSVFLNQCIEHYMMDPVVEVKRGKKQKVFDFTVPNGHSFVGNGMVNHNTRVLTHRIAYLINQGVSPSSILAITFTNKAADEMKSRVQKMVRRKASSQVWISTFHSMCAKFLRQNPKLFGVQKNYTIADADDSKVYVAEAASKILKRKAKDILKDRSEAGIDPIKNKMSDFKKGLVDPDTLVIGDISDLNESQMAKIYVGYNRVLKKNNALDFDDLLMRVALSFQNNLQLRNAYASAFKYILVDEYQDTNHAQYKMSLYLDSINHSLFLVGDMDQSIFSFNGSKIENMFQITKDYQDITIYKLEKNFRSFKAIADVANRVIKNNTIRMDKEIITVRGDGEKVQCIKFEDPYQEASAIADDIQALVRSGKSQYKDFAILYRINSKSRPLEEALVTRNVPCKVVGARGFYSRKVVKDILAYMKLVQNSKDNASFSRIYNEPPNGLGERGMEKIQEEAEEKDCSVLHLIKRGWYKGAVSGRSLEGVRTIKRLFRDIRGLPKKPVHHIVQRIVDQSGYVGYLKQMMIKKSNDEKASERIQNQIDHVYELIDSARNFDATKGGTLRQYLEFVALIQSADDDKKGNKVLLMSIHASKGLEFPQVYLVACNEGVLPSGYAEAEDNMEEERRLFFVATTRAEDCLKISCVNNIPYRGPASPSRFIKEAGDTLSCIDLSESGVGKFTSHKTISSYARGKPRYSY